MRELTVNQFRSHLRESVDQTIQDHQPLRITRRGGKDFVVVGAEDWEREQETLYVLQNASLMAQINRSLETHQQGMGHVPADSDL
jgi:antitoxin YefM